MKRILNFGSLNIDYVYRVPHFVRPGETLDALAQHVFPGGKGLNQSVALSRAGARVLHAGCAGKGGETLTALLRENGVDTTHIVPVDALQGNALIQVDAEGENCILLYGGSNRCVTREQIDRTLDTMQPGEYLLLQNEINDVPYLLQSGKKRGLRVVLNPSPYNDALENADYGALDWLFVNEIEANQITGRTEPDDVWQTLHTRHPQLSLLLTLGSQGSAAYTPAQPDGLRQAAFPVQSVDTTAAGDAYTGFFLCALAEGKPVADCMRLACAAAAISVTRSGASPSIPTRAEAEAFLRQN